MKIHTVQLNIEDFDNGTSDLSPLEFAIYTRLFLASYNRDLPDCNEKLSRIARCKRSEIVKCRQVIDAKFKKVGDFLKNSRAELEREHYKIISNKNKSNARERWKIKGEAMPTASISHNEAQTDRNASAMLPNTYNLTPNNLKTPTPFSTSGNKGGVLKNLEKGKDLIALLNDDQLKKAKKNAPSWDIYNLADIYVEGVEKRGMPNNPPLAFIGWCLKYTKGNPPS